MIMRGTYDPQETQFATRAPSRYDDVSGNGLNLIAILWRRKLLIVASVIAFLALGLIYIAIAPPKYLSSTSILIDPRLGKGVGTDPVQPGFVPDASSIDSQIKLLTSQTVLTRVGKIAHLADDPEFNGSQSGFFKGPLGPNGSLVDGVNLKALEAAISIKRPERTYVVGIDVLARDPDKAAEIANAVAQAYIEDQVSSRVNAAKGDTTFVRQRLDTLAAQIKDAENKVETYKIDNKIIDANGLRSNQQQITDLTKALGDARAQASTAKAKMTEIDNMAKRGHLDAASEAVTSPTIERLRTAQAETDQNVAKLMTILGARHPELIEARGRAAKIAGLIRDELQRLKLSAAGDYREGHDRETQLEAQVDQLTSKSATMNLALVPLDALEANVRVLRASFDRFAQVGDNLSQQEADSPPGRVIAVARPAVSPSSPKKSIVGAISLAAGLFFGLAGALFAESTSAYSAPARAPSVAFEPPPGSLRQRVARRYWDDDDDDERA